ncbi:DUF397 domain-containing protein [Cryptosporangium sp. NPDC051539]|uniref:DUF397 domain-containing protein n=1 Tax=Cryptosporangium sp. NPDC051539 TaxID=3363962 RepID=UPI0037A0DC4A
MRRTFIPGAAFAVLPLLALAFAASTQPRRATVIRWRRSTYCRLENCVEAASTRSGSVVLLRSSAAPYRPPLALPRETWVEFLHGLRSGDFVR